MNVCGVKNRNGYEMVNAVEGTQCTSVAKYVGTFEVSQVDWTQRVTIGLCEQHAYEARVPEFMPVVGVSPVKCVRVQSLPQDIYKQNLAFAELSSLVA